MPMLWVFKRVAALKNRTGWYHVADDKLAAKLLADGVASLRFNPRQKIEGDEPRPMVRTATPPPGGDNAKPEPPPKARKATK